MPLDPIIHCVIDREPTTFHASDAAKPTVAYAVNLSFEVASDAADEAASEAMFVAFLSAAQAVQFQIYLIEDRPPGKLKLKHDSAVERVPEAPPLGNPSDLRGWLKQQGLGTSTYWTTVNGTWNPDVAVDADAAAATHRLRAAQGWNAPVGHKFALTHILRIPAAIVLANDIVVLPYFDAGEPAREVNGEALDAAETVFDFKYSMLGTIGPAGCRTTVVEKIIGDLVPPDIDPALTADGYLKVDADAANVHRLLTWFEARAASLLAIDPALNARRADAEKDEPFEQLFGLRVTPGVPPAETFHWGSLVWFVVARLVATRTGRRTMRQASRASRPRPWRGPCSTWSSRCRTRPAPKPPSSR